MFILLSPANDPSDSGDADAFARPVIDLRVVAGGARPGRCQHQHVAGDVARRPRPCCEERLRCYADGGKFYKVQ